MATERVFQAFRAPYEAVRSQTADLSSAARRADGAAIRARLCGLGILTLLLVALTWLGLDLHKRAGQ